MSNKPVRQTCGCPACRGTWKPKHCYHTRDKEGRRMLLKDGVDQGCNRCKKELEQLEK